MQEPGRATARTVVADVVGAGLILLVIFPEVLRIFADELGEALPEPIRLWLGGAVLFTAGLAGAVTRIMAIPRVNRWLAHIGLAADAPVPPQVSSATPTEGAGPDTPAG